MVRRIFSSWTLSPTRFTIFFSRIAKPIIYTWKSRLFFSLKAYCVYISNKEYTVASRYGTSLLARVQLDTKRLKQFIFSCSIPHTFAALTHVIASWTLEEKFHINAHSCIILYIFNEVKMAEFVIQPQCNRLLTTEKFVDECKAIKLVNKCSRKNFLRLELLECEQGFCVVVEL